MAPVSRRSFLAGLIAAPVLGAGVVKAAPLRRQTQRAVGGTPFVIITNVYHESRVYPAAVVTVPMHMFCVRVRPSRTPAVAYDGEFKFSASDPMHRLIEKAVLLSKHLKILLRRDRQALDGFDEAYIAAVSTWLQSPMRTDGATHIPDPSA